MIWRWRRAVKHWFQRRTRGWDDTDLWNLDATITRFALPRLRRFREVDALRFGVPDGHTDEQWISVLDELIWFLEIHAECNFFMKRIDMTRYAVACELWGKHFGNLWT